MSVAIVLDELRTEKKIVGLKQSLKAVENGNAKKVFVARDAEERVVRGVIETSTQRGIEIEYVNSMKELGKICGIGVGASVVCVTK